MNCKCGGGLEEYPIEIADVADGDGLQTYSTDMYYRCYECGKWYDDEFDECEEPVQGPLI